MINMDYSIRILQLVNKVGNKAKHIKPTKKQIKIPKIGWVDWIKHSLLEGKLKSITIKRQNNKWWCICICELPDPEPIVVLTSKDLIGIDLGLIDFVVTSEDEHTPTPKYYRNKQEKLAHEQRKLSKKEERK